MNTHLFSKLPLALTVFSAALCLNCVEVMRQKCERTKTKNEKTSWIKIADCVWERQEEGRLHTARIYTHTPHVHTHSPLAVWDTADTAVWPIFGLSTGPDRAPEPAITALYLRINPVLRRQASSFQKKKFLRRDGSVTGNLVHSLTHSLLRRNFPSLHHLLPASSSSCERLKMPLIPLCRLGTLLGSKGEGVRHSQPLVYIGPDHEMMALT